MSFVDVGKNKLEKKGQNFDMLLEASTRGDFQNRYASNAKLMS